MNVAFLSTMSLYTFPFPFFIPLPSANSQTNPFPSFLRHMLVNHLSESCPCQLLKKRRHNCTRQHCGFKVCARKHFKIPTVQGKDREPLTMKYQARKGSESPYHGVKRYSRCIWDLSTLVAAKPGVLRRKENWRLQLSDYANPNGNCALMCFPFLVWHDYVRHAGDSKLQEAATLI